MPRTEYPRPWLGGRWTLRDIVDYELIATMATLEYAADRRETLLRQIYEVNRATVEAGSTYRVRPNDTLWQIASAANPGPRAEVNRTVLTPEEAEDEVRHLLAVIGN